MSASNFDELTRYLAVNTSRRQAIKAIFAGALGGMAGILGLGGPDNAQAAGSGSFGATCKQSNECCTYTCDSGQCNCRKDGIDCSGDFECCSNTCDNSSGKCRCRDKGISCNSNNECCSGVCTQGQCA